MGRLEPHGKGFFVEKEGTNKDGKKKPYYEAYIDFGDGKALKLMMFEMPKGGKSSFAVEAWQKRYNPYKSKVKPWNRRSSGQRYYGARRY